MEKNVVNYKEERWFFLAIILLAVFFIFKLVNQSQIIWQFPLDCDTDFSAHLGQLHFLKQYGFHKIVPNWYNGYMLFLNYPIAWYFFTLPIYVFLNNILLATFISHTLLYLIGFLFFLLVGRVAKLSLTKTVFFYLVFFANPIAIGNFIKLGRMTELIGIIFFIAFFALLLYFKDRPINVRGFLGLVFIFAAIILSHPSWTILSALLIPAFFILKSKKDKFLCVAAFSISILLTAFWLFPFLFTLQQSAVKTFYGTIRLLDFKKFFYDNIVSFILPVFMWFTAFFYFKNVKEKEGKSKLKREIIFYSLSLLVSFLYLTRTILFIPVINRPFPNSYHLFFIFLGIFFFVKTPLKEYGSLRKLVKLFLVLLPFIFIIYSLIAVRNFRTNNEIDKEIISLLGDINLDDKFLIEKVPYPTNPDAFYSYAAIYYNLSTPSGWIIGGASNNYFEILNRISNNMDDKNCETLLNNLKLMNTTKIITYKDFCANLNSCGLTLKIEKENICLYSLQR